MIQARREPARRTARIVRCEQGLGTWTHAVRRPDPRLAPLLYGNLIGYTQERVAFGRWLEAPRPALTLMIDLEGVIRADERSLPDAWLAGFSDRYTIVEFDATYASLDIQLTPLGAYRVLGRPVSSLEGEVVGLADLFGCAGDALAGRVRDTDDWDERFDLVEEFLLARVAAGPTPTPAVEWVFGELTVSGGQRRIRALAQALGCSRRYLSGRFTEEVGLAPKTVARLIRFDRVCTEIRADPAGWADIAAGAGFCDQSHLNREFRALAGTTPADFLARCIPGGGVIGDGCAVA